jgi:hypothetical protein
MHLNRSDVIIVQLPQYSNDIFSYIVKPNLIRLFPTGGRWQRLAISDNWNHLMRLRHMKYIGFKHQRENKQNSDKYI